MLVNEKSFFSISPFCDTFLASWRPLCSKVNRYLSNPQLNVFHWHMTDTNSFPFELKNPEIEIINQYGLYDALSIYDQEWIKTFVEYATKRGEEFLFTCSWECDAARALAVSRTQCHPVQN